MRGEQSALDIHALLTGHEPNAALVPGRRFRVAPGGGDGRYGKLARGNYFAGNWAALSADPGSPRPVGSRGSAFQAALLVDPPVVIPHAAGGVC